MAEATIPLPTATPGGAAEPDTSLAALDETIRIGQAHEVPGPQLVQPTPADQEDLEEHEKKANPWALLRQAKRALNEERKSREQLAGSIGSLEERLASLAAETRQPVQQAPAQSQTEMPSYEADPLGYLKVRTDQAVQLAAASQQQSQAAALQQRILADEQAYASTNMDYAPAREFLVKSEWNKAKALGMNDQEATQYLSMQRALLIGATLQKGQNVGHTVFELAKQAGFRAGAAAQEKVHQQITREQVANTSLGNIPSVPGGVPRALTKQDLLNMSEEEMDRMDRQNARWDEGIQ